MSKKYNIIFPDISLPKSKNCFENILKLLEEIEFGVNKINSPDSFGIIHVTKMLIQVCTNNKNLIRQISNHLDDYGIAVNESND